MQNISSINVRRNVRSNVTSKRERLEKRLKHDSTTISDPLLAIRCQITTNLPT